MRRKKKKRSDPNSELYDEFADYISQEGDKIASDLFKDRKLKLPCNETLRKLEGVYEDAVVRIAIAEDCLKKKESFTQYKRKVKDYLPVIEPN